MNMRDQRHTAHDDAIRMTYLQQRIPQIRRLLQEHPIEARPFVADRRSVLEVCEEVTFGK